jgi:hypothetical protein
MRLRRKPEPIALDPVMEAAKQEKLAKDRKAHEASEAASKVQADREKVCGASSVGHVYDVSRTHSTRPTTYECVGCGKLKVGRY